MRTKSVSKESTRFIIKNEDFEIQAQYYIDLELHIDFYQ